jgi:hypothetical protein
MTRSIPPWFSLLWKPKDLWEVVRILWLLLRIKAMNFFSGGAFDEYLKTTEAQLILDEMRKKLESEEPAGR